MDMFGDSDFESYSETSSDDQDDIFSVYSGQAQSILSSLEDTIGKIDDFLSFERGFIHGDIVCSTGNPSGQMGRIVNVELFVDLENVFGEIIKDINSKKLSRMRSVLAGDYVICGSWLGRVAKVVDCVGIRFDDGTNCEVMATDQERLIPVSPNLIDDSLYAYHPGQRVKLGPASGAKSGWLCGISKKNQNEGTIYSVEVGSVYVDWLTCALVKLKTSPTPPPCQQDTKNLNVLSCFSHVNWQLGDWCILQVPDMRNDIDDAYISNLVKEQKTSENGFFRKDFNAKLENLFSIVKKKTRVNVLWQDGSTSSGLDSHCLIPVSVVNAHDFFPGQFVLEKPSCDDANVTIDKRWGFVRSVNASERTVKVKWKTIPENSSNIDDGEMEETVSAYELVEHPDFCYSVGDIVFTSEKNHQSDGLGAEEMGALRNLGCGAYADEVQKICFLSCIGNVVGFTDGNIEVQWANGITTKVAPNKIFHMEKDDGPIATQGLSESNSAEFSLGMTQDEKQSLQHGEKDLSDVDGIGLDCQGLNRNTGFFGLREAAVGFFSGLAANFFGAHGSSSPPLPLPSTENEDGQILSFHGKEVSNSSDINLETPKMAVGSFFEYEGANLKREYEGSSEDRDVPSLMQSGNLERFRQFDVVGDCSDHHFVDGADKASAFSQVKKVWLKKVQQEWSILEKDLPETIYVRIYEERMDLIRAAIVGAPGTPYHDGLFVFDIFLPPDYPYEPPMVHYHSGGLRLNPNLYESGRVCLSLLNTWTGIGSEIWNPESSTVLQVLLSLQALVLNEKPYFNEAGYDTQMGRVEGEKNSVSYNENAFLVSCMSMLCLLRRPPKHFEVLVNEHFNRRAEHILSACKAYMEGAPIGFVFGQEKSVVEPEKGNSTGFKIMLGKLIPRLMEAFSDKGINCGHIIEVQK